MSESERQRWTACPPRNFTITVEQRLSAIASGPRAYMLRRKRIEDLTSELVHELADLDREPAEALAFAVAEARALRKAALPGKLALLNQLIEQHNRYFPIEANLPMDRQTGELIELGQPWRPLAPLALSDVRELAGTACPTSPARATPTRTARSA